MTSSIFVNGRGLVSNKVKPRSSPYTEFNQALCRMKINANFSAFAATNFDPAKYISSPSYGVNRFMLDRIGDEKARATTIVEYKPNSKFPEHVHIGGEEFLVLAGTFKDQFGAFPAGTYVRNPIDSKHAPWVDDDGCTILVKLLQMAETPGEGTTPLHIECKRESGTTCDYGTVLELYKNEYTGERVQMCWIDPEKQFLSDDDAVHGGEELFVVSGTLSFRTHDVFERWGWLRFPVGTKEDRDSLRGGASGAQVFRKTGHLTDKALSMEKIQLDED